MNVVKILAASIVCVSITEVAGGGIGLGGGSGGSARAPFRDDWDDLDDFGDLDNWGNCGE